MKKDLCLRTFLLYVHKSILASHIRSSRKVRFISFHVNEQWWEVFGGLQPVFRSIFEIHIFKWESYQKIFKRLEAKEIEPNWFLTIDPWNLEFLLKNNGSFTSTKLCLKSLLTTTHFAIDSFLFVAWSSIYWIDQSSLYECAANGN